MRVKTDSYNWLLWIFKKLQYKYRIHCLHDHLWSKCSCKVSWLNTFSFACNVAHILNHHSSTCIEKLKFNFNSTRVSNELGAGNPERAKHAMNVTLKLSLLLGFFFVLALGFGHKIWIQFFSDSSTIQKEFASVTPFLAISILLDAIQGVLSGKSSSFLLTLLPLQHEH